MSTIKRLEERLNWLKLYYETRRGGGHSRSVLEGVLNSNATLIVATANEGRFFENTYHQKINWITLDEIPHKLAGLDTPLVIDHHALTCLIRDMFTVVADLQNEIYMLKHNQ